jgi:ribosomal protein S18 acetylase RimI-like enzyme
VLFLEWRGEPVGFLLGLPDLNELMLRVRRTPTWLRPLRFLWLAGTTRPGRARIAAMGVLPSARGRALDLALFAHAAARARTRYPEVELSWVQDINPQAVTRAAAFGLELHKTYRIYEKPIGAASR